MLANLSQLGLSKKSLYLIKKQTRMNVVMLAKLCSLYPFKNKEDTHTHKREEKKKKIKKKRDISTRYNTQELGKIFANVPFGLALKRGRGGGGERLPS